MIAKSKENKDFLKKEFLKILALLGILVVLLVFIV